MPCARAACATGYACRTTSAGSRAADTAGNGHEATDTVASVTAIALTTPINVYDMEVAETHNFGVTCSGLPIGHTVVVSNSEYMFLDDTACNLASLNLTKFLRSKKDGQLEFDVEAYRHAARVFFIAQEILVDLSSYPTAAAMSSAACQGSEPWS